MNLGEAMVDAHLATVVPLRPLQSLAHHSIDAPPAAFTNPIQNVAIDSLICGAREDERRQRLHWLETSEEGGSPIDLLRLILSYSSEEVQASKTAKYLIDKFSSIGSILSARHEKLREVASDADVTLLRSIFLLARAALREPVEQRTLLRNLNELYDYLRLSLSHEQNEIVRLLFLTNKNALLKDELHSKGTINHTPVYPREIVKRVIELNANALIIVHNHPSGDPKPSTDDIEMTRLLARVLKDIGVELHDHIIVGRSRCESLRSLGLM